MEVSPGTIVIHNYDSVYFSKEQSRSRFFKDRRSSAEISEGSRVISSRSILLENKHTPPSLERRALLPTPRPLLLPRPNCGPSSIFNDTNLGLESPQMSFSSANSGYRKERALAGTEEPKLSTDDIFYISPITSTRSERKAQATAINDDEV